MFESKLSNGILTLKFFLTKYKLLYEYQFGFRKGHSTSLALISIIDKVSELLDSKQFVIGVYLDLTKAFDTVKHDILLRKLDIWARQVSHFFQVK